jgi:hypothetical protein
MIMDNELKHGTIFSNHHKLWCPIVEYLREQPSFFEMTHLGLLGQRVNYDDVIESVYNEAAPRTY